MLNQPSLYDNATLEDSPSLHLAQVQWHYSYHFTSSSFIHFYSAEFLIGLTLQIPRIVTLMTFNIMARKEYIEFHGHNATTVELPNNGHIGSGPFVLYIEVVPLWKQRQS